MARENFSFTCPNLCNCYWRNIWGRRKILIGGKRRCMNIKCLKCYSTYSRCRWLSGLKVSFFFRRFIHSRCSGSHCRSCHQTSKDLGFLSNKLLEFLESFVGVRNVNGAGLGAAICSGNYRICLDLTRLNCCFCGLSSSWVQTIL